MNEHAPLKPRQLARSVLPSHSLLRLIPSRQRFVYSGTNLAQLFKLLRQYDM